MLGAILLHPWFGPMAVAQSESVRIPAQPDAFYPVDRNPEFSASLNGTWKFKLGPAEGDFTAAAYDDSAWKPIQVPGNWELQGFEEPLYRRPGDKDGFYRRAFTVSDEWKGRRVFLRFEGVGFAFEFFVNGRKAGSFASAFNRSEFDITDFIEFGKPASLAVHVTRREKGWEFDTNDDWALSGIHRDVLLFSIPETHLKDYTVVTPVSADGKDASVRTKAWLGNFVRKDARATLEVDLTDPAGNKTASASKEVSIGADGNGEVECELPVKSPKLWTAETPDLYQIDLRLSVDGKPVHQVTQRVGLRSTSIEGGVFKLNGKPVKFRGINHHDMHPETGRAMTRDQYVQDLELMKAANINTIRMAHYPPQKVFLDLCDEYGMYVLNEVPFGFGEEHLTDDTYEGILATRAKATVACDKNRTSVMVWTVGNENPYTPMVVRTAGLVKALDPFRSRCIAHPTGQYYFQPPTEVDIIAPHYLMPRVKPDQVAKGKPFLEDIIGRTDITAPVLMTEYAHAAGTSMERLKETWEVMESSDRFIGGCVWEFQDQGIYRTVPAGHYPGLPATTDMAPVEIGKVKAGTWVAADRVLDTNGQEGADGIVDSDRTPSSDYWAIRKIYSPVFIPVDSLTVKGGRQKLEIPVKNRHDFTDLSAIAGSWEFHIDGRKVQNGKLDLKAAPRTETLAKIEADLALQPQQHDQFLRFIFTGANGREIVRHAVRLLPETSTGILYKGTMSDSSSAQISMGEEGPVVTYSAGASNLQVNRETGSVSLVIDDKSLLDGLALRVGRASQMSEIRAYGSIKSAVWDPYLLTDCVVKSAKCHAPEEGVAKTDLTLQFNRQGKDSSGGDAAAQGILADIHLTFSASGWTDIDYELKPVDATDHLLELGLAFQLPKQSTRLTWLGKGPFAVYPLQAEGMERGVHSVEPKADFDPANRAYGGSRTEVDLASATDVYGNGLGMMCRSGTVSLEPLGYSVFFSHILLSAGHGEKRSISVVNIKAKDLKPVKGSLRLVALGEKNRPEPFRTVFGPADSSSRN